MQIVTVLCWLSMISLSMCDLVAQASAGRSTKNRFFLLSQYTPDEISIDKKAFAQSHKEIASRGVSVYRNGETYYVIVPWKSLFITRTDNLTKQGQDTAKYLSQFLSFYRIEYMQLTGFYPTVSAQDEPEDNKKSLPGDLVAQRQASRLVVAMQKSKPSIARVSISVSDEIIKTPSFISALNEDAIPKIADPGAWFSVLKNSVIEVHDESQSPTLFNDGGVIIRFKKY